MANRFESRILAEIGAMRRDLAAALELQRRERQRVLSELALLRDRWQTLSDDVRKLDERLFDRHGALLDILRRLDALAPEGA